MWIFCFAKMFLNYNVFESSQTVCDIHIKLCFCYLSTFKKRCKVWQFRFCEFCSFQIGKDASSGVHGSKKLRFLICFAMVNANRVFAFLRSCVFTFVSWTILGKDADRRVSNFCCRPLENVVLSNNSFCKFDFIFFRMRCFYFRMRCRSGYIQK